MKILPGNYLVAGASGLMGTAALLRLKDLEGISVMAVYHQKKPLVSANNISYIQADLRNLENCRKVVEGMDYVFMFAAVLSTAPVLAKNPVSHITSNLIMNAQMLEAAYFSGVKKFLWLSSSTGYPPEDRLLNEEDMFLGDPADNYFSVGWMSRYTEVLCRMYATKLKNPMPAVILRPTTIYGEYESFDFETSHVLPALVRKVVERHNPLEVWGDGKNMRDLLYADDMIDACFLALTKTDSFNVFNIGYGQQYSINKLLEMIIKADGSSRLDIVYNVSKPSAISKRTINIQKSQKVLGFYPKTPIEQGIRRMVAWYKDNPVK